MTGFDPRTSGIGNNYSTHRATPLLYLASFYLGMMFEIADSNLNLAKRCE